MRGIGVLCRLTWANEEKIMALFELFRFLTGATKYVSEDPAALKAAGNEASQHQTYHRRVVSFGAMFGVVGVLLGIPVVAELYRETGGNPNEHEVLGLIAAPMGTGVAGACFGVAMACLFAPRTFLEGPMGKKWMKLIGTKSVSSARLVCFLVGLVLGGIPLILGLVMLSLWLRG
jgi:hypothetical protein